jgi:dTDP-4-dehydrorhamnose 3,5-epimerase
MPNRQIEGVEVKDLKIIPDERGMLAEILRSDEKIFKKFGQVYFTTAYPGVVKGWHYHKVQWDHFVCLRGLVKLVLYDSREGSPTFREVNEFFLGIRNPKLVAIPPLVYHGFKCVSEEECLMINIPTEPYHHKSPDEFRAPWNDPAIPYDWARKDG